MKKLLAILLAALLATLTLLPAVSMAEDVELVMGSWRNTDAPQVEALLKRYKEISGVTIRFEPTVSSQYNATLRLQLDNGTGPDLFYSRSYATGEELYNAGFNMVCNDIPGVMETFTDASREPFTAADGSVSSVLLNVTDGEKLSTALAEAGIISQEEADAGFVTTVNGETADYNKDQAWWCLTDAAGEMTTVGVADIELHDGDSYAFTYTKG